MYPPGGVRLWGVWCVVWGVRDQDHSRKSEGATLLWYLKERNEDSCWLSYIDTLALWKCSVHLFMVYCTALSNWIESRNFSESHLGRLFEIWLRCSPRDLHVTCTWLLNVTDCSGMLHCPVITWLSTYKPTVYVCRSAAIQTLTLAPAQLLFKSS